LYNSVIFSPKEFTSIFSISNKPIEGESTSIIISIRVAVVMGFSTQGGIIGAGAE